MARSAVMTNEKVSAVADEAREAAKQSGRPRKSRFPTPETAHGKARLADIREVNRKRIADTEKRDAGEGR